MEFWNAVKHFSVVFDNRFVFEYTEHKEEGNSSSKGNFQNSPLRNNRQLWISPDIRKQCYSSHRRSNTQPVNYEIPGVNVISRFINRYIGNALYMYPRVDWNENHFHSEFRILKKREKEIRGNSWTLLLLVVRFISKASRKFH